MTRQPPHKWTDTEKTFLRDNYLDMTCKEIGEYLGLTREQVKGAAGRYGIKGKRRPISDEEKELFIALYPDMDTAELAKKLDRTVSALYGMSETLGVKKSEAYQAEKKRMEAERLRDSGVAHRFKKGTVPPNKGLRRPGWHRGRMKETQFKKGERTGFAKNLYQPIGTERLSKEGYLERKVNDDLPLQARWKAVHRIVWEELNGPIPEGHVVVFRDHNKQNCDPSNLELITRAALMKRNTMHNYPGPVRAQIHVLAGFRRKLNRYAKK